MELVFGELLASFSSSLTVKFSDLLIMVRMSWLLFASLSIDSFWLFSFKLWLTLLIILRLFCLIYEGSSILFSILYESINEPIITKRKWVQIISHISSPQKFSKALGFIATSNILMLQSIASISIWDDNPNLKKYKNSFTHPQSSTLY